MALELLFALADLLLVLLAYDKVTLEVLFTVLLAWSVAFLEVLAWAFELALDVRFPALLCEARVVFPDTACEIFCVLFAVELPLVLWVELAVTLAVTLAWALASTLWEELLAEALEWAEALACT